MLLSYVPTSRSSLHLCVVALMGIDLNAMDDALDNPVANSPHSLAPASFSSRSSVCLDLWHACAGPLISLPPKGSFVMYLPQGHLEQATDFPPFVNNLPPHVLCRVIHVNLRAEAATDEVYAQVSLVPQTEVERKLQEGEVEGDGEEEIEGSSKSTTPHMFCKTLTASDTSTHGGLSVPRRAAENCFPPLDYKQQRPSQELIAKDLHGIEWSFRHIYRGQPRRHLLTTGWSAFVNKKKLISGDAVLFLRGEDGELRLGIRRAAQLKSSNPYSALGKQRLNVSTLAAVANAVATKSAFHINYNPRASPSEFIIPYRKFCKSFDHSFSIGVRFKMRFDTEDAAERRYTGVITGIGDMDPLRWPGSKWRCLSVRWDNSVETNRQNRVSPWEIDLSGSVTGSSNSLAPPSKRTRISLPSITVDFPVPNGSGVSDFGEPAGFQKVSQGQEILCFRTPYDDIDVSNCQQLEIRRCNPVANSSRIIGMGSSSRIPLQKSDSQGESARFHKVLHGQEIFPWKPSYGVHADSRVQENGGLGIFEGVYMSSNGSRWPPLMQGYDTQVQPSTPLPKVSSPSSVLMFQQANGQVPCSNSACDVNDLNRGDESSYIGQFDSSEVTIGKHAFSPCQPHYVREDLASVFPLYHMSNEHNQSRTVQTPVHVPKADSNDRQGIFPTGKSGCRLFGCSLTKETTVSSEAGATLITSPSSTEDLDLEASFLRSANSIGWGTAEKQLHLKSQTSIKTTVRSSTKVHKQGSVVGRAIDLSKLGGYNDLICELERLFNMEGLLNDPEKGWQVVYTDGEDDMMLVGDDPWHIHDCREFCNIASKILIYTRDEVVMMPPGVVRDDAHSCSEEAPHCN
ncbi:auxin response factor 15-like isoform X2 [Tasmannia lanceolata]|uniref:auxin response factor 15-like isoform X2 n=1 Tax=Tasmannia lanceolata TaxID=3420 RepID=UPI0040643B90